jgi:hypothetical protein
MAFGAAWKILDLTIEWGLHLTGRTPRNKKYWQIEEKKMAATKEPPSTSNPLNGHDDCWQVVLSLYAATEDYRHSLVHRTLHYDPATLHLSGNNEDGKRLKDITKPQLMSFIAIAQIVAQAVSSGEMNNRKADHLKFELDQLQSLTQQPSFDAKKASRPVKARVTVQPDDRGTLTVDFPKIKQQVNQCVPDRLYDLCLNLAGTEQSLEGHLEETPNSQVELNTLSLPDYLYWV